MTTHKAPPPEIPAKTRRNRKSADVLRKAGGIRRSVNLRPATVSAIAAIRSAGRAATDIDAIEMAVQEFAEKHVGWKRPTP